MDDKHGKKYNFSWLSVGVYGLYVLISTVWLSNQHDEPQETYTLLYALGMLISTGILVGVSKLKGPKAKWRWCDKDSE